MWVVLWQPAKGNQVRHTISWSGSFIQYIKKNTQFALKEKKVHKTIQLNLPCPDIAHIISKFQFFEN